MSSLERYLAGEHEQVWAELVALGEAVREEPIYSDALAVARETMGRVRWNIETLVPRLRDVGYEFGYGWTEPDEEELGAAMPPSFTPPSPSAPQQLDELERQIGAFPLSLRAFYEEIGSINFVGVEPDNWRDPDRWRELLRLDGVAPVKRHNLDPIFVTPLDWIVEEYREFGESGQPYDLYIAPDELHKYFISGSGGYEIEVPSLAADAPFVDEWHDTTFVNYLRICLRWAGFLGFDQYIKPPLELIARLTDGLRPI